MKYKNQNRFKTTLLHGAILAALSGTQLVAAEADTEESAKEDNVITVTARKKSESILDVPMNIATVGEMEIADRNLLNKEDMFRSIAGAASPRGQLILRGLSGGNDSAPDTTTTFTDGVPYDFGDLYDVERIEVLRGPQGTLYGSNAIGGTVRIITNKPRLDEFEIKTSVQINSEKNVDGYDQRLFGAINMPLSDEFALRITGNTTYDPKSITNVNTGNQGYSREHFLRTQLLWQPQKELSITVGYVTEETNQFGTDTADLARGSSYYDAILTANDSAPFGYDVEIAFPDDGCTGYRVQCMSAGQGYIRGDLNPRYNEWELMDKRDEFGADMFMWNIEHENIADIASFSYVGSKRDYKDYVGLSSWSRNDGGDMFRTWLINDYQYTRTTHEIRFQSLETDSNFDWSVGYFYDKDEKGPGANGQHQYHGDGNQGKAIATALWGDSWGYLSGGWTDLEGNYADITNVAELGMFYWNNPDINYSEKELGYFTKEQSFFGEMSYTMDLSGGGEIEFAAGIRFYDLKDYYKSEVKGIWGSTDDNGVHIVNVDENSGSEDGNRLKFSASWRIDSDTSVYALYSEGYRPGGNNINSLPQSCREDPNAQFYQGRYTSDEIENYELGYKAVMMDGNFRISSAVYQIDWTGVQAWVEMGCGFGFYANAATAQSQGLEIETETNLTDDLTLSVNFGYTSSEMTEDVESLSAKKGDDMTMVPKFNFYMALDQGFKLFERQAYARLEVEAYDEYKTHFKATDEDMIPAYEKVNLSARIELKEGVDLSVHINNLLDEEIINWRSTTGNSYGDFHYVDYAQGRNLTLRINYTF